MNTTIFQSACAITAFASAAVVGSWTPGESAPPETPEASPIPTPSPQRKGAAPPHATPFATRLGLVRTLAAASSAEDFRGLLFPGEPSDWYAQQLVLARWCDVDPAAAAEALIARAADIDQPKDAIRFVFGRWAGTDPDAAYAAVARFSNAENHAWAAALAIFNADAETDPTSAIVRYASVEPSLGSEHLPITAPSWARRAPATAARLALVLPPESAWRQEVLDDIVGLWTRIEPEAALDFVRMLGDDAFAGVSSSGELSETVAGRAIATLGCTDVVAALGWIEANVTGLRRHDLVSETLKAAAESDPITAAPLIAEAGTTRFKEATGLLLDRWVEDDLPAALDWARAHWRSEDDGITAPLVHSWGSRDRGSLAEYVKISDDAIVSPAFVTATARVMAQGDVRAAIAWASSLPTDRAPNAVQTVFYNESLRDPVSMANRLADLPTPELRESAAASVAIGFYHRPPAAFDAWATSQPDPAIRAAVSDALARVRNRTTARE